ncbi:MAG: hypothetical protein PHD87_07045 [Candidatus Cloacimonetes bacterium]|nr:hypothetical protein [Candidatus Cloacimonadota bacterium]
MKHHITGPVAILDFCAWLDYRRCWPDHSKSFLHRVDTVSGNSHTNASRLVRRALGANDLIHAYGANPGTGVAFLKNNWGYGAFGVNFSGFPAPGGHRCGRFTWVRIPNEEALDLIKTLPWQHVHFEEGNAYARYPRRETLGRGGWIKGWNGKPLVRLVVERSSSGRIGAFWEAEGCAERRCLDPAHFRDELARHSTFAEALETGLFGLPRPASETLIAHMVGNRLA